MQFYLLLPRLYAVDLSAENGIAQLNAGKSHRIKIQKTMRFLIISESRQSIIGYKMNRRKLPCFVQRGKLALQQLILRPDQLKINSFFCLILLFRIIAEDRKSTRLNSSH